MRLEPEWTFGGWPPTRELVWCLFDLNSVSSIGRGPQVFKGRAEYVNKELLFFEDGEAYPLHPSFQPICWRLSW